MGWQALYPMAGATALIPLATWLAAIQDAGSGRAVTAPDAGPVRVGSASCSGRGCHGKVVAPGLSGGEYTTWAGRDPHAAAYLALFDCRSESIQHHLRGPKGGPGYVPPFQDPFCMACHGRADAPEAVQALGEVDCSQSAALALAIGPSGVGCEDCHGPAGPWLDLHYRDDWPGAYPEAARSMANLRPTAARAEACLRCHSGDGLDREVNHDLIAAGHPRLTFELGLDSERMPRHWDQAASDAKRASEGLPARDPAGEWAVGQVASLRAALGLLADRARPPAEAPRTPPWPEFAEYACFGCHHATVEGGLHYSRSSPIPGSLAWASWASPMARALIERARPELIGPLDEVALLMSRPLPEGQRVSEAADRLHALLGEWLGDFDEGGFSGGELRALLGSIANEPGRFEAIASNWDAVAQLALACRALLRSEAEAVARSGRLSAGELERLRDAFEALGDVQEALEFPAEHSDSPGSAGEPDPWSDRPRAITSATRSLLELLASEEDGAARSAGPP